MKKMFTIVYPIILGVAMIIFPRLCLAQSVAINEDGSVADPSAILDIKSANKGLLIPRMNGTERSAIASPAEGLKVFDTDTKTFWFYNGTVWIELASGGSTNFWSLNGSHIFNNNAANVGIGTDIPAYKFTVQTLTRNYGFTHTDGTVTVGSYVGGDFFGANVAGWLGTISNHPLNIYTNNGIGQVSFKTDFGMDLKGTKPYIQWFDGGTASGYIQSNGINLELSGKKEIAGSTPGNLILQADDITNPVFFSQYAGNVGIGTRNPVSKLHIIHPGPVAHLILEHPLINNYSTMIFTNGTSRFWGISGKITNGANTADRLTFYNTSTSVEVMAMTGDGNVGIGTANPTYKLSVNGNIRSKEVVVESGWADYVFENNYQLPALADVERFIQQNKHLPNIPSAKEIEKKGLHLGDVQKRMMEKIEELTLYVIQLKKEIDALKSGEILQTQNR